MIRAGLNLKADTNLTQVVVRLFCRPRGYHYGNDENDEQRDGMPQHDAITLGLLRVAGWQSNDS